MKKKSDDVNIVKLKGIENEMELDIIKSILEDNNIPYIIRDYGMGGHMRILSGTSVYSTDVMVSEEDFNKSKDLLESISIG